jgi:hypothetical protein
MPKVSDFLQAARSGDAKSLRTALRKGMDVNARITEDPRGQYEGMFNRTALELAVCRGHAEAVQVLVDAGADLELCDVNGHTPLRWACCNSEGFHAQIAEILIRAGADVNARDNFNGTVLHGAALDRNPEAVKLLVKHGARVNAVNNGGDTPLHSAVGAGHVETTKALLNAGAKRRKKNKKGETPVHCTKWVRGSTREVLDDLLRRRWWEFWVRQDTRDGS